MGVDAFNHFAVELHDQAKNAVGSRVLGPEVDRVVADALVARVADVPELAPLASSADTDLDAARALRIGARSAAAGARFDIVARVAHGFLLRGFLLTSLSAFCARGLRASFFSLVSAGLPAPVCAGAS